MDLNSGPHRDLSFIQMQSPKLTHGKQMSSTPAIVNSNAAKQKKEFTRSTTDTY